MKKKLLILCLSFVLFGCSSSIELSKQTFTIELGQDVYANPALYVKNSENIRLDDYSVSPVTSGIRKKDNRFVSGTMDYLVVGEYDFVLKKGDDKWPFKIKIKDTKPPTIVTSVTEITVKQNAIISWQDYLKGSDLSGVSYSCSPILDTGVLGDTQVVVTVSDRFGNAVSKEITAHVQA